MRTLILLNSQENRENNPGLKTKIKKKDSRSAGDLRDTEDLGPYIKVLFLIVFCTWWSSPVDLPLNDRKFEAVSLAVLRNLQFFQLNCCTPYFPSSIHTFCSFSHIYKKVRSAVELISFLNEVYPAIRLLLINYLSIWVVVFNGFWPFQNCSFAQGSNEFQIISNIFNDFHVMPTSMVPVKN